LSENTGKDVISDGDGKKYLKGIQHITFKFTTTYLSYFFK